jgi:hypothetical protein
LLRLGQLVDVFEADESGSIDIERIRDLFLQQKAA